MVEYFAAFGIIKNIVLRDRSVIGSFSSELGVTLALTGSNGLMAAFSLIVAYRRDRAIRPVCRHNGRAS